MNKTFIAVIAAALAGLGIVSLSNAENATDTQVFDVAAGGTLNIDSDAGTIEVASHDEEQVVVKVTRFGSNQEDFIVEVSKSGNDVNIEGDKKSSWSWNGPKIRYEVTVPKSYNVNLRTGGGSIDIEDIKGEVEAHTSGGSISLGEITGDVNVKTSGGSIRVEDVAGNIRAHTSGGSIKAKLSKQITDDCKLTTSGGSITAYLNPEMAVDLDAGTSGGSVRTEFSVAGKIKRSSIEGQINGGGPTLKLKTSGGSVTIKEI